MTPFLGAGAVIVGEDDRLLLVVESSGVKQGKWSLPAGKVEPGESIPAAVIREVEEETGLVVEPVDVLGFYHSVATVEGVYGLNTVVRAVVVGGELAPSAEHPEVRYVSRTEIESMLADGAFRSGELMAMVLADFDAGRSCPLSTVRTLGAR